MWSSQRKCAPQCNERLLKQDANCDNHLYKRAIAAALVRAAFFEGPFIGRSV